MDKIKQLFIKYEEIIIYLIVGVLTTVVSWGAAWVAKFFLDDTVATLPFDPQIRTRHANLE